VVALLLVALPVLLFLQFDPRPAVSIEGSSDDRDVARAEDFYFRYSRDRNEAAIALYERILARNPDHAGAQAGLANALVQRAMRWPDPPGPQSREFTRLGDALQAGHLQSRTAVAELERAEWLARAAVRQQPDSPAAHKALGLVLSASGEQDAALESYRRTVELDPDAWGAMINIADVHQIRNQPDEALTWFEFAHAAMTRVYDSQSAHVQPWYSELAVVIGDQHLARDELGAAERWYRTALEHRPLHPEAMRGLARALSRAGQHDAAREVCERLRARIDAAEDCLPDS
jgi:tetratricopeptide (TPR) repeat protein